MRNEQTKEKPASHTASGQSNASARRGAGGQGVVGGGHSGRLALLGSLRCAVLQFQKLAPDQRQAAGLPVADDVLANAQLFGELADAAGLVDCVLKDVHGG